MLPPANALTIFRYCGLTTVITSAPFRDMAIKIRPLVSLVLFRVICPCEPMVSPVPEPEDPADELSQTIIWSHWDISNLAEPFCKT
ncbi:hypothetical protein EMCRGX_G031577 [Ephydatia muelleri]